MMIRIAFAASVAALSLPAAAAPDPLLAQIIAGARATPPVPFERTSRIASQEKTGASETHVRVDRWDGRSFTLVSMDGKSPEPKAAADFRKAASARPVPGYHRIADLLQAGSVRHSDAQGRPLFKVTSLPKGSIQMGKDLSSNLVGEFTVDTSGSQPYVSRARFVLPKPVSFFLVAKLDSMEIINDYKLGSDGRPYLARVVQVMSGAQFGKQGSTRTETSYTLLR
jgi:hypothetical protein